VTVAELIALLQQCDQTLPVSFENDCIYVEVGGVDPDGNVPYDSDLDYPDDQKAVQLVERREVHYPGILRPPQKET
jgi:hypothetical protein